MALCFDPRSSCASYVMLNSRLWQLLQRAVGGPLITPGRTFSSPPKSVQSVIEGRFAAPAPAPASDPRSSLGLPGELTSSAGAFLKPGVGGLHPTDPRDTPKRRAIALFLRIALPISGTACLWYAFTHPDEEPLIPARLLPELQYLAAQKFESNETLTNWSGTHEAKPRRFFQVEKEQEVEAFLRQATQAKQQLRVVGSALSPNALIVNIIKDAPATNESTLAAALTAVQVLRMGLSSEGTLSMALMDKVVRVDVDKQQVTVQAGCRVQQVADALAPHGLTLQNYASIRDQQIGGFVQVGAHGTGAGIPPVEEQVVSMRLVTPGLGTLTLSQATEPELFSLAKVGLGALGVVSQVTLQCVPRHKLVERTFTTSSADIKKNHVKWLQENKHMRYLWIPYTETVVVVQANPVSSDAGRAALAAAPPAQPDPAHQLASMRELLMSKGRPAAEIADMPLAQLRDELVAVAPTSKQWIAKVNQAEAEAWQRGSGATRTDWSDQILGFDCGGQQWVKEVALPMGPLASLKGVTPDLKYMEALLKEINSNGIPAPSPIEQRWTSGSSASMSPAAGPPDSVHSWVGVIMYLPQDPQAREQVTQQFQVMSRLVDDKLAPRYNGATHWAKLEVPAEGTELAKLRARLAARFPVAKFNAYREVLDPCNILANDWVKALMPLPEAELLA